MPNSPIQTPASYVPSHASAFADSDGTALVVSGNTPMPVTLAGATAPAPLAGTTASSAVLGPYQPVAGRPVVLTLTGTWTGTVKLQRSVDGGATRLNLTLGGANWGQFTANCCEPVWEETEAAARLYIDAALASGTLGYRIAQ